MEALRQYDLLDTLPEQAFDDLTALAARICDTPTALITFIDEERRWVKSRFGPPGPEISRGDSLSAHAILERGVFLVPDTALDERFADNPLVTGGPRIRFYAGAPLVTAQGHALGVLCVMDRKPRELTVSQQEALQALARQVMSQLQLRRQTADLAEREQLLTAIFDSEPECVKLLGPDGSLRMMNRAGLEMIEADSFAQVENRCIYPIVAPEYRAKFEELTGRVFRGESVAMAYRIAGLKGASRWLETHAAPLRDKDGKVASLLAVTRDMTARQHAEAEAQIVTQRLKLATEAASIGIWDWDVKTDRLSVTDTYLTMLGYDPRDGLGDLKLWIQRVHPDDRALVYGKIKAALAGSPAPYEYEARIRHADGAYRWIHVNGRVVERDDAGRPARLMGVRMDVTERKEADLALKESEARFRTMVDSVKDYAIFMLDMEGRVVSWNEGAQRVNGYQSHEIIGRHFSRFYPPEDAGAGKPARELAIATAEGRFEEEGVRVRKDGSRFIADVIITALHDDDGRLCGFAKVTRDITERKQAELALRASETRYRTLVESASDGILVSDAPGRLLDANAAICRMFGYSREELLALSVADIVVPDEVARIAPETARLTGGEVVRSEWHCLRKDGTRFPVEVSATSLSDGRLLGILRDATERQEAARHIQQLNRVYSVLSDINQAIVRVGDPRAMLENACGIAVDKGRFCMAWIGLWDGPGEHIRIAAHAGASEETLRLVADLLGDGRHNADCAFTLCALREGRHGVCNDIANDPRTMPWREAALQREYRSMASLPLKAGDRVIGAFNLYARTPGFFDADELRLLDELATDISFALEVGAREKERRKSEEELRWRTAFFEAQVDSALDGILVVDSGGRKILQNQRLNELWKITPEIAAKSDSEQIAHIAGLTMDPARFAEQIAHLNSHPDEISRDEIELVDGSRLDRYSSPVRDKSGTYYGRIWTFRDITERRQLEEQLRQSRKMEAIGQLAGGVAHDFNNILAVIMMQASLADASADLPKEIHELLEGIKSSAERAANLTRQLLAFSRRQVMQTQVLDLNDIVTSLTRMLQRILGEDVRLHLSLHSRPLMIRADPGMLDQILLNLVVNARDAMPGGGELTIGTGRRTLSPGDAASMADASPGRYVWLSVADTGSGIPPELLERIFEPFFTTKELGKGTGLGLATVFGIVKQHAGLIIVESQVSQGTTFQILLPEDDSAVLTHPEEAPKPEPGGGTETILLVEDDAVVRMLTRTILERAGYHVLEAPDGVKALQIGEQHVEEIRLVLTDIVMPEGVTGRELAARLQARNPHLRVIFTSGYSAEIAGRELALEEGQNFLQKPASARQILEIVRRTLDG